ncbi:MAG: hypothetical protein U0325_35980 [Polyangiales bacterium]
MRRTGNRDRAKIGVIARTTASGLVANASDSALALHAERLAVTDPSSGAALEVASPLPDDLAEPIARILRGEEIAPPDR